MRKHNRADLQGNIGIDPVFEKTEDGRDWVKFTLATDETWKTASGEEKTKTEWHNVTTSAPYLMEQLKTFKKGDLVRVEGKITYTSKEIEGKKQTFSSISPRELTMVIKKPSDYVKKMEAEAEAISDGMAESARAEYEEAMAKEIKQQTF